MSATIRLMSEHVKRIYDAPLRQQRAAATRSAIRVAAHELFLAQGFAATTMREIAARAGIGERTLYDAFNSKAALFDHLVGVAIVGDELPTPVADRDEFHAALAERDGCRAIALFAEYSTAILERAAALIVMAAESSGADADLRVFTDRGAAATRDNVVTFVDHLAAHDVLAGDPERSVATVLTSVSPHTFELLRTQLGWTADGYRAWLEATLTDLLLAGDPPR
jgi:AcrR family transcriptional regulator